MSVQKFGVQVLPSQISKPAFLAAILEVLTTPSYADTAQAMSVKIRARKRTPAQEGAGEEAFSGYLTEMLLASARSEVLDSVWLIKSGIVHADWIEHAIETKGEPYLWLPAEDLPFFPHSTIATFAILGISAVGAAGGFKKLLRVMGRLRV